MTKKSKNKFPEKIFRTGKIIAHWREYYRHKESHDLIWKIEEIDEYLNSIAKYIGRPLTKQEESELLDIIDEFTPQDKDNMYLGRFPAFERMWEVYQLRMRDKKDKK